MPKPHPDPLNTQITPESALEKRTRRQFKPEYKLRILAEADACKHGELGTPEQVFTDRYHEVAVQKQRVLDGRYERHPERFVRGRPIVPMPLHYWPTS